MILMSFLFEFNKRLECPNPLWKQFIIFFFFFLSLAFTNRILGKIRESWPEQRVTKGIHFPRFLHPTSSYKAWLDVDVKSIPINEKAYKRFNKRKRTD